MGLTLLGIKLVQFKAFKLLILTESSWVKVEGQIMFSIDVGGGGYFLHVANACKNSRSNIYKDLMHLKNNQEKFNTFLATNMVKNKQMGILKLWASR